MREPAIIESCNDNTKLIFSDFDGECFTVAVENKFYFGRMERVSIFMRDSPTIFFNFMAQSWRSPNWKMTWATYEEDLCLKGSSDTTGHFTVEVRMNASGQRDPWRMEAALILEAGQLEAIARAVSRAFSKE